MVSVMLYVMCCPVNGSVCFVCCVFDSVCERCFIVVCECPSVLL